MKRRFTFFLTFFLILILAASASYAKKFDLKEFKNNLPKLLGSNNVGKEFWVTFNPCWETSGAKNDLYLYISSGVQTTVTVEIPGKGYLKQQTTIPNDVIEFILTPSLGQCYRKTDRQRPEPDQIFRGYGVHVYADQPIIVYGVTRYQYTSDSYLSVPISSLGKDYVVASWDDISSYSYQFLPCYTAIVSPYDNNTVRFTMGGTSASQTVSGQKPGETTKWTLYKGDVLLFSSAGAKSDLSGSRIRSTKPVAVLSSNFCAYIPDNIGYCDYTDEMELPTNTWGTEYHYSPIYARKKNSIVKIFAKEAGTNVYRDGLQLIGLKTGSGIENVGWYMLRADEGSPRPIVFSGDKPIYVEEFNCGQDDDGVASDPFAMVLTPLEQYQREIIFNTPGIKGGFGFTTNYINLVYRTNDDGTIPDDLEFATVQGGNFTWKKMRDIDANPGLPYNVLINGHKYSAKTLLLPGDGVYKIRANDPFAAYAYGFSPYDSYGHPTSVALGDLERPDTLPPDPTWKIDCYGTVDHNDGLVEDMPRNADRSNLSMIVFDADQSFNYKFSYDDFIPGEDAFTHWSLDVINKSKDAQAVITFTDRRGNDTTIVITYTAKKLTVRPDLDFGLLAVGQSKDMDCWVVNQSTSLDTVTALNFKDNLQGFQILNISFPIIIPPKDSVKFTVRFTATVNGSFKDSIGVVAYCFQAYKAQVKARVGSPRIAVSDWNFGDVSVGTTGNGTITIKNIGTTDLTITGYTDPTLKGMGIYLAPDLQAITDANPLTLAPNQTFTYDVLFVPGDTLTYLDSMLFTSNTEKNNNPDSVALLSGRGIKPDLVANSYDWGRRRIDRTPQFPAGPYPPDNNFQVIKLINGGTQKVKILSLKEISNTNGSAFEFDKGAFTNVTINEKDSLIVPVMFHPVVTGEHVLVLQYDNSAGSSTQTTLHGIGIVPKAVTADVNFGSTIIQDTANPSKQTVKFTNLSPSVWDYGDTLTITDLSVLPNGTIATDLTSWGTEGFRYDKSQLKFPIKLAQGEFIEFDGQFVANKIAQANAALQTVSDADAEVTSNWTGTGVAQGIKVTTDVVQTCLGSPAQLICHIDNTGSSDLFIDSLVIQPLGQTGQGVFTFANPSDARGGYPLLVGEIKSITINYTPASSSNINPPRLDPNTVHQANLIAYNSSIFTPVATSITPMQGTTEHHYPQTSVSLSKTLTAIGDVVGGRIILNPGDDLSMAKIDTLDVTITYNGDFLKVNQADIQVGGLLKNHFQISNLSVNDISGKINLLLTSTGADIFNYPSGGELLTFNIGTFLPTKKDSASWIAYSIQTGTRCVDIDTTGNNLALLPTCVFDLRKVITTQTNYGLKSVNPNPVTSNTAEIEFSVGLSGYTEIKLYNSNSDLVAIPVKGDMEPGLYNIRLDVSNMSNGAYWYEMTSGPYHSTQKMIIAR